MGISLILGGLNACPDGLGHLLLIEELSKFKWTRKKVPKSARLSAGSNRYLGNAQMEGASKI